MPKRVSERVSRGGRLPVFALLLAVLLSIACAGPIAHAADIPNILPPGSDADQTVSARELDTLIQTLENDKSRGDFLANLKALRDAQQKVEKDQEKATGDNWLARFSSQLRTAVGSVAALGSDINLRRMANALHDAILDPAARRVGFEGLMKILAILGAGVIAHVIVAFTFTRPRRAIEGRVYISVVSRLLFALLRLTLDILPLAAGAGVALAVAGFIEPRPVTRLIALALINALVACEALMMASRFVLAPHSPNLRVPPLTDETSNYLYIWICRIGYVALYGYFLLEAALLLGLSKSAYSVLVNVLGLVIAMLLIIFVLQNRDTVSRNIRGGEDADGHWMTLRRPLAAVWHLVAIFYVVALYLVLAMRGNDGTIYIIRGTVLTAIVLLLVWGLDNAVRGITKRGLTIAEDISARFPGLQMRVNRYTTAITVLMRLVIGLLAAATILEAWGVEVFAWIASPLGQRVASATVSIGLIVALALFTWELASSLIERQLTSQGRVSTRALTLLPLARTALRLVLIVLVTMVVLAEIGMNITPLLAGAGVIGLAVGFGAQKLVQDVITGWFILMEDTISVGDNVDLGGGHAGVVERINIRTIQMRDGEGAIHTIPFSAVNAITNKTRDFSFYQVDLGVSYDEDTDRVGDIIKGVAQELDHDDDYKHLILAPAEIDGVERFEDNAVILRVRIRTRVGQQARVGHEFNRRLKKALDEQGIRMPIPRRAVTIERLSADEGAKPLPQTTD